MRGEQDRAHPRSRGEHQGAFHAHPVCFGSSPLTRGARTRTVPARPESGLIPAHAASTLSPWVHLPVRGAHPRSRGEHWCSVEGPGTGGGSSPLTRGAPPLTRNAPSERRLIPAHAGSTRPRQGRIGRAPAHPRSRGEHLPKDSIRRRASGSSPLTRGALSFASNAARPAGLIPAHAGSTSIGLPSSSNCGAHPRSRGEHVGGAALEAGNTGSSPLTRGALNLLRREDLRFGLIPAHAGST